MDDNNVLKGLKDLINNARKLKIDYGITGPFILSKSDLVISVSSGLERYWLMTLFRFISGIRLVTLRTSFVIYMI